MTAEQSFFVNVYSKPSYADIVRVVGNERASWDQLNKFLKDGFKLKGSLSLHDTFGWVVRFHRDRKVQLWLIPDKDSFKIVLPQLEAGIFDIKDFRDLRDLYLLIHNHVKKLPPRWLERLHIIE